MVATLDAPAAPRPRVAAPSIPARALEGLRRAKTPAWLMLKWAAPFLGWTVMAASLVAIGLLAWLAQRANAPYMLAQEVGYAPSYDWNVAAAGYWVCGELARGATQDEVIAAAIRDGIGGDLYTSGAVARLVVEAPRLICPTVDVVK